MILQTNGAVLVPVIPAVQSSTIQVHQVFIDLDAGTVTVVFSPPGNGSPSNMQRDTVPLPGPLRTSIEAHAQARVEASLGISGTTITVP